MSGGGGRKGLPQSFLSRFSRVFVDAIAFEDMVHIAQQSCTKLYDRDFLTSLQPFIPLMVRFVYQLQEDIGINLKYGRLGCPWEFNLRDMFRWVSLIHNIYNNLMKCMDGLKDIRFQDLLVETVDSLFVCRMRSVNDRESICLCFYSVFKFAVTTDNYPSLYVRSRAAKQILDSEESYLVLGSAVLSVNQCLQRFDYNSLVLCTDQVLLGSGRKTCQHIAHCISMKLPCLLVGSSGSGKKKYIRYLAHVTGNLVVEYYTTPATDASELIGSFEQTDAYRNLFDTFSLLETLVLTLMLIGFQLSCNISNNYHQKMFNLLKLFDEAKLLARIVLKNQSLLLSEGQTLILYIDQSVREIETLTQLFHQQPHHLDLSSKLAMIRPLLAKCRRNCQLQAAGHFEWIDGVVVRAMERGYWVVLNNVNLCSASVLDRLNSLLEEDGKLMLTEGGTGRVLTPHPNFRIFFTMSPNGSEVSRAMRNRCVEICILPDSNAALVHRLSVNHSIVTGDWKSLNSNLILFNNLVKKFNLSMPSSISGFLPPVYNLFSYQFSLNILQKTNNCVYNDELKELKNLLTYSSVGNQYFESLVVLYLLSQHPEVGMKHLSACVQSLINNLSLSQHLKVYPDILAVIMAYGQTLLDANINDDVQLNSNYIIGELFRIGCYIYFSSTVNAGSRDRVFYRIFELLHIDLEFERVLALLEVNFNLTSNQQFGNLSMEVVSSSRASVVTWIKSYLASDASVQASRDANISESKLHHKQSILWCLEQALFNRYATVFGEAHLKREFEKSVNDDVSYDSNKTCCWTIAYALVSGHLVPSSKTHKLLMAIYQVMTSIERVAVNLSIAVNAVHLGLLQQFYYDLHRLWQLRDKMSYILQSLDISLSIPWDRLAVVIRWTKKHFLKLLNTYSDQRVEDSQLKSNSSIILDNMTFESTLSKGLAELEYFDHATKEFWQFSLLSLEKSRLWNEGGHASIPNHIQDFKQLTALCNLLYSYRLDFKNSYGSFVNLLDCESFNDKKVSRTCLAADRNLVDVYRDWIGLISTFYWAKTAEATIIRDSSRDKVKKMSAERLMSSLNEKFQLKLDKVATCLPLELAVTIQLNSSDCNDTVDIISCGSLWVQMEEETRYLVNSPFNLSAELAVIRLLQGLTNYLASLLMTYHNYHRGEVSKRNKINGDDLRGLKSRCDLIMATTIRYTGFELLFLRELQSTIWCIDSCLDNDSQQSTEHDELLLKLMTNFLVTLNSTLYRLLSRNCVNDQRIYQPLHQLPTIKMLLSRSQSTSNNSMYLQNRESNSSLNSLMTGPARLLQPVVAQYGLRYLDVLTMFPKWKFCEFLSHLESGKCSSVSILSHYNKNRLALQLFRHNLFLSYVSHLNENRNNNMIISSSVSTCEGLMVSDHCHRLELICHLIIQIIISCRDYFRDIDSSRILQLYNEFTAEVLSISILTYSQQVINLFRNWYEVLDHCSFNNSFAQEVFQTQVLPLINIVIQPNFKEQYSKDLSLQGRVCILAGLSILTLISPGTPVDPASVPGVKISFIQSDSTHIGHLLRVQMCAKALSTDNILDDNIKFFCSFITANTNKQDKLATQVIERPSREGTQSFLELFEEITNLRRDFVNKHRIDTLLESMVESCQHLNVRLSDLNDLARTDIELPLERQRVELCMQQEISWQSSVLAFVDRMALDYSEYEDITSPVVSALQFISQGVRVSFANIVMRTVDTLNKPKDSSLQFLHNAATVVDLESEKRVSVTDILKDVLSFPFTVSTSGHLQSLLRLLTYRSHLAKHTSASLLSSVELNSKRELSYQNVINELILFQALHRIIYLTAGDLLPYQQAFGLFEEILTQLNDDYSRAQDDFKNKRLIEASLYRFKAQEVLFETNDEKDEDIALRKQFPDHLKELESLNLTDDDNERPEMELQTQDVDSTTTQELDCLELFDDFTCLSLARLHAYMVFVQGYLHLSAKGHVWTTRGSIALDNVSTVLRRRQQLSSALLKHTLLTGKALEPIFQHSFCESVEPALRGLTLAAFADSAFDSQTSTCIISKSQIDQDLVLLLADMSEENMIDKSNDSVHTTTAVTDFQLEANVKEVVRVKVPLQAILKRAAEILQEYPGNEIVFQICKITAFILDYHASTPLGQRFVIVVCFIDCIVVAVM